MESFGKHREISITSSKPESERSFNDKNVAEIMENEYQVQKNVLDESLRQRYRQYELNPNLHKDHNYHLDQFLKNYTNSGIRWVLYWGNVLKRLREDEFHSFTRILWRDIKEKYRTAQKEKVQEDDEKSLPTIAQPSITVEQECADNVVVNLLEKYDLKVQAAEFEIQEEFARYQNDFKTYPKIKEEMMIFMQKDDCTNIDEGTLKKFQEFWHDRVKTLCFMQTLSIRENIRLNWKKLISDPAEVGSALLSAGADLKLLQKVDSAIDIDDVTDKNKLIFLDTPDTVDAMNEQELNDSTNSGNEAEPMFETFQCSDDSVYEADRDMKYLLAWHSSLTKLETDKLLELQKKENPQAYIVLQRYLELVQIETVLVDSEDDMPSPAIIEVDSDDEKPLKMIPITRRKSK